MHTAYYMHAYFFHSLEFLKGLLTCSLMIYLIPLQNIVSAMPKIQTRKIRNFSDFHSSFDNDDIV